MLTRCVYPGRNAPRAVQLLEEAAALYSESLKNAFNAEGFVLTSDSLGALLDNKLPSTSKDSARFCETHLQKYRVQVGSDAISMAPCRVPELTRRGG